MDVIASITGLSQGYGGKRVIEDMDLEIGTGILGLLGPNGAGKTTLLRTLATVAPPLAGTLNVLGTLVSNEPSARRARSGIGYLPQAFGFFPSFTVLEFVYYNAWLRGIPRPRADTASREAVAVVGLADRSGAKMKSLSGGMLRRVGIASAIVGSPRLILLDEPTVGLDPAQRVEFRDLLRSLTTSAIMLSTHLVEDVAAVCDEVAVMVNGGFLYRGTPAGMAEIAQAGATGDSPLERAYMTILGQVPGGVR